MKKHDEIKKALKLCQNGSCKFCPYDDDEACGRSKNGDALAYIQQLESRLAQAERERDAAKVLNDDLVEFAKHLEEQLVQSKCKMEACLFDFEVTVADKSITGTCHTCKHDKTCDELPGCYWEWRGVCEENTKEEK